MVNIDNEKAMKIEIITKMIPEEGIHVALLGRLILKEWKHPFKHFVSTTIEDFFANTQCLIKDDVLYPPTVDSSNFTFKPPSANLNLLSNQLLAAAMKEYEEDQLLKKRVDESSLPKPLLKMNLLEIQTELKRRGISIGKGNKFQLVLKLKATLPEINFKTELTPKKKRQGKKQKTKK